MFDELAEAEFREKIAQLEGLIQEKERRIAELAPESHEETNVSRNEEIQRLKDEQEQLRDCIRERETQLAYISKELNQCEHQVEQFKELVEHTDKRLVTQTKAFDLEKVKIHRVSRETERKWSNQVFELEQKIEELDVVIQKVRQSEKELTSAREASLQQFEEERIRMQANIDRLQQVGIYSEDSNELLDSAREELERFQERNTKLEKQNHSYKEEVLGLNQFLETTQAEIGRLNSDLRTLEGLSKQKISELESAISLEQSQKESLKNNLKMKLSELENKAEFLDQEKMGEGITLENAELKTQLQEIREGMIRAESKREALEKEIEKTREVLQEREQQLEESQHANVQADEPFGSVSTAKNEILQAEAKNSGLQLQLDALKTENRLLHEKIQKTHQTIHRSEGAVFSEAEEINQIHQEWMEWMTAYVAELEAEVQVKSEDVQTKETEIEALQIQVLELEDARNIISQLDTTLNREENAIRELVERNLQTEKERDGHLIALENAHGQIAQHQAALHEAESSYKEIQALSNAFQNELETTQQQLYAALEEHHHIELDSAEQEQLENRLAETQQELEIVLKSESQTNQVIHRLEEEKTELVRCHEDALNYMKIQLESVAHDNLGKDKSLTDATEEHRRVSDELVEYQKKCEHFESKLSEQSKQFAHLLEVDLPGIEAERDQLQVEMSEYETRVDSLQTERNSLKDQTLEFNSNLQSQEKTLTDYEVRLGQQRSFVEDQNKKLERMFAELTDARSSRYDDKRSVNRFKTFSYMAHAAVVFLALGFVLFYSGGGKGRDGVVISPSLSATSSNDYLEVDEKKSESSVEPFYEVEAPQEQPIPVIHTIPEQKSPPSVQPEEKMMAMAPGTERKEEPNIYTIKKGESLWLICKRKLGDGSLWKKVAKDNKLTDRAAKRLMPGDKIVLNVAKLSTKQ